MEPLFKLLAAVALALSPQWAEASMAELALTNIIPVMALLTLIAAAAVAGSFWMTDKATFNENMAEAVPQLTIEAKHAAGVHQHDKELKKVPTDLMEALNQLPEGYTQFYKDLYSLNTPQVSARLVPSQQGLVESFVKATKKPLDIEPLMQARDLPSVYLKADRYVVIQPFSLLDRNAKGTLGTESVVVAAFEFKDGEWTSWKISSEAWATESRKLTTKELESLTALPQSSASSEALEDKPSSGIDPR